MDNNRQIKFRAVIDGKIYEPFNPFDPDFLEDSGTFPERTIFEQFTGLTDKEGKEIFEGDVLEFELEDLGKERGVVRFSKDGFWTSQAEGASEELLSDELKFYKGKVKIVGTIH